MSLPPHWQEVEQLQAKLRESRSNSRAQRMRSFRAMGYSEAEAQARVDQQDTALRELETSCSPPGRQPVADVDLPPLQTTDEAASAQVARTRPAEPVEAPPRRMTKSEIRAEMYARGELRPVADDVDVEPVDTGHRRVEFDLPSTPGSTGRWLTGGYRFVVGTAAGAAVAVVAWIALQLLGVAAFDWTMWHPVLMLAAAVLPALGLAGWVSALARDVRFYVRVGGRAPATWSKW